MLFGYFTLFVALLIEVVGAYYSITGLAAIFSGAVIPILIMGGSLELGKVTAAVWLKNNWHRASAQFKLYLLPAVVMLMLITSMGIFGFLSKAHNDQTLVSGDVTSKIAIYDEKIKIQRDNIDSARRALQQMDAAVDQTMSRSSDEKGADKATAIRRSQARERGNLQGEIARAQAEIVRLNDQRAPIAAEVRKVEAEVGPIKYIAKLIYDGNPDANILEKAVTWVIITIVAVFDPLALVLILAAQQSIRWAQGEDQDDPEESVESWFARARRRARFWDQQAQPDVDEEIGKNQYYVSDLEDSEPVVDPPTHMSPEDYYRAMGLFDRVYYTDPGVNDSTVADYEPDDGPLTAEQLEQIREATKDDLPTGNIITKELLFPAVVEDNKIVARDLISDPDTPHALTVENSTATDEQMIKPMDPLSHIVIPDIHPDDHLQKLARNLFMSANSDQDERVFHAQHQSGKIDQLPWLTEYHINNMPISDGERKQLIQRFAVRPDITSELAPEPDNVAARLTGEVRGFGTQFPNDVKKGDMFLRVDRLPSALYKYNGTNWIEVDKTLTDNHAYDKAYIDHLIAKIDSGEYDPELLSDAERDSIEKRLNQS